MINKKLIKNEFKSLTKEPMMFNVNRVKTECFIMQICTINIQNTTKRDIFSK